MKCKRCSGDMDKGQAMVPVWGNSRNNLGQGATLYPISAIMRVVCKCRECGYSVSFDGMITGFIREGRQVKSERVITFNVPSLEVT